MSDADLRTEFEVKARNLEPFKLVEFNRFATGEFVSIVAESGYIGYRMRDEELNVIPSGRQVGIPGQLPRFPEQALDAPSGEEDSQQS